MVLDERESDPFEREIHLRREFGCDRRHLRVGRLALERRLDERAERAVGATVGRDERERARRQRRRRRRSVGRHRTVDWHVLVAAATAATEAHLGRRRRGHRMNRSDPPCFGGLLPMVGCNARKPTNQPTNKQKQAHLDRRRRSHRVRGDERTRSRGDLRRRLQVRDFGYDPALSTLRLTTLAKTQGGAS